MLTPFQNDEERYLAWLRDHPRGFVLNTNKSHTPATMRIHRASCQYINGEFGSNFTTNDYYKVCADDTDELDRWLASHGHPPVIRCSHCHRPE
ncbi:MAG: hypothetical protein IT303_16800 [Dehalococcoidia bacterium]|nr:hypothetical protein [Dehalococcoidia bacterium]